MVERDSPVRSRTAGKRSSFGDPTWTGLRSRAASPALRLRGAGDASDSALATSRRTGPLVFTGRRVIKNLRSGSAMLVREQRLQLVVISCAVVTSNSHQFIYKAASILTRQVQHELDRIRDLLSN